MQVNQLKAGTILNYVILGLQALVGILYTPFMLREMGQSEYGLYSLAASVIAYLSMLDFGFGNAVIRYTAKFRAEGKVDEQYEMFGLFTVLYSVIGIVTLIVGIFFYVNLDSIFGESLTNAELGKAKIIVLLMIFNLAVTFPLSIYGAIITAYEDFIFLRVVQIARILLNTAVMIALLSMGYKAIAMVLVNTVLNIATLLINLLYCRHKIKIKVWLSKPQLPFLKEISIYSFWIFLNAIMDKIYWSTGQFILGAVIGTVAVAIYSVSIQLRDMYFSFSTAISGVFLPKVTALVAKGTSREEISDLFIRVGRIQYIIMAFILSGFVVFGKSFVNLWAGEGYSEVYYICLMFFFSAIIPLVQNLGITILQARNEMEFRSLLIVAVSVISLFISIPVAKRYGALGVAEVTSTAILIGQGLLLNIYYQKRQGLNLIKFWKEILRMSIIPVIIVLLAYYITSFIAIDSISKFLLGGAAFSLIYIPLFYKLSMNNYERGLFISIVKKIYSKI